MNVTGAMAKFNPKLEPLIKTAQKFKTNELSAISQRLDMLKKFSILTIAWHQALANALTNLPKLWKRNGLLTALRLNSIVVLACKPVSTFNLMDFCWLLTIVIAAVVFAWSLPFQELTWTRLLQFGLLLIYRFRLLVIFNVYFVDLKIFIHDQIRQMWSRTSLLLMGNNVLDGVISIMLFWIASARFHLYQIVDLFHFFQILDSIVIFSSFPAFIIWWLVLISGHASLIISFHLVAKIGAEV